MVDSDDDKRGVTQAAGEKQVAGEGPFLSRWARRKNAASTGAPEPELEELQAEAERQAVEERAEQEAQATAEELRLAANREAAEAVDLETVDEATDFTVFMKEGVPTALRQMALKKLWRTHPIFGVLDGLNDYDQDFNVTHTILTKFESAWKVGKGYAKKSKEEVQQMIEEGRLRAEAAAKAEAEEAQAERSAEAAESEDPASSETEDAEQAEALEPAEDGEIVGVQADDMSNETVEPVEEDLPKRVPLRRRFALEDWE